jgi:hypothetical protein
MVLKKALIVPVLAGLLGFPLSAATISFLVVETGLQEGNSAAESSGIWENALMDAFFDAGHIVSNAPIMRLNGNPGGIFPSEAQKDFDEAVAGGADFFVLALIEYQGPPDKPKPQAISLRLFKTTPYKFMFEQRYAGKPDIPPGEEFAGAKDAGRTIISHLDDN